MYEPGPERRMGGDGEDFIDYVPGEQILEETVVDGLIDVDNIETVLETADGYGFINVPKEDHEIYHEGSPGKRRYRMRQRAPAVTYFCEQCNKHIKYPSKIQEHMRKHNGDKPYHCRICGARFSQGHVLRAHIRAHDGERPYKCSYCERCFATTAHRNSHEKALHHDGGKDTEASTSSQIHTNIYVCPFDDCGYQSQIREEVEDHLTVIHNCDVAERDHDGEAEGQLMWTEYSPEEGHSQEMNDNFHMYAIDDHVSELIDPSLDHQAGPSSIIPKQEPCEDTPPPGLENPEEIEIDSSQYHLQSGKETHHEEEEYAHGLMNEYGEAIYEEESVQVLVDPLPPKRGRNVFGAPRTVIEMDAKTIDMIRPKAETYRPRRTPHNEARNLDWIIDAVAKGHDVDMSSPHNRKKPQVHTCVYCGKVDKYPSKIEAHMRTHTGEKPFKCTICGMTFAQRTPMRLHMRRHLNQKPFACPFDDCGESFVSGSLRNLHVSRKHLKEKKYVCIKGCGRCFASAKNQRTHEAKCFYNREEDEPVYQQLLYEDGEQEETTVEVYHNGVSDGGEEEAAVKWDHRIMNGQLAVGEELVDGLIEDDGLIYMEQPAEG